MHPWHDCYIDEAVIPTGFPAVIEIPRGSTNKYELDKETGLLRLDRVLHSAVYYPADYGWIAFDRGRRKKLCSSTRRCTLSPTFSGVTVVRSMPHLL